MFFKPHQQHWLVLQMALLLQILIFIETGSSETPDELAARPRRVAAADRQGAKWRQQQHHHQQRQTSSSAGVAQYRPHQQSNRPSIITLGANERVIVGNNVTLPCEISNYKPNNHTVIWRRGYSTIMVGKTQIRQDMRVGLAPPRNTSLVIRGADTMYSGNYTCEVEWDKLQTPPSITHYLEVLVPPSVYAVEPPSQQRHRGGLQRGRRPTLSDRMHGGGGGYPIVSVVEGRNATLECRAEGVPKPTIEWTSELWESYKRESKSRLELHNVRLENGGEYTCTASNGVGEDVSDKVLLRVQHVPKVRPSPGVVDALRGQEVRLTCHVVAQPSPNVIWKFNGKVLSSDSHHKMEENGNDYSLLLWRLSEEDLGNYTCLAINNIGEAEAAVRLTGAPMRPVVTSSPHSRFHSRYNLTWTVRSFAPLTRTDIKYKACGWYVWKEESVPAEQATIYDYFEDEHDSGDLIGTSMQRTGAGFTQQQRFYLDSPSSSTTTTPTGLYSGSLSLRLKKPECQYEVRLTSYNKYGASREEARFTVKTSMQNADNTPLKMASNPGSSSGGWFRSASVSLLSSSFVCFICASLACFLQHTSRAFHGS